MSEPKHSRLPWTTEGNPIHDRILLRNHEGTFGHFQGWSSDGLTTEKEDKANAELIIRAVNCHDELVEAVEGLLNMSALNRHETITTLGLGALQSDIRRGVEALAKAKGTT